MLMEKISQCDWSAARFLVELLQKGTFRETLGGWGELYLLMDGENLVSFATSSGQDAVRDESLTPWIGFVYTAPEYRGHRHAGKILTHAAVRSILPPIMWVFMKSMAMSIRKTASTAGAAISGCCIRIWRLK